MASKKNGKKTTKKAAKKTTKKVTKKVVSKKASSSMAKKTTPKAKESKALIERKTNTAIIPRAKEATTAAVPAASQTLSDTSSSNSGSSSPVGGANVSKDIPADDFEEYEDDEYSERVAGGIDGNGQVIEKSARHSEDYNPDDETTEEESDEYGYGWDYDSGLDDPEEEEEEVDIEDEDEAYTRESFGREEDY